MTSATLLRHMKRRYDDGAILELKLWLLPRRIPGSHHPFKYSLYYGTPGTRILGYDNEAGKGDHVHRGETESDYLFTTPEKLLQDFLDEVGALRGGSL
jgi:Family of unknown function (DUF6516)